MAMPPGPGGPAGIGRGLNEPDGGQVQQGVEQLAVVHHHSSEMI